MFRRLLPAIRSARNPNPALVKNTAMLRLSAKAATPVMRQPTPKNASRTAPMRVLSIAVDDATFVSSA